MASRKQPAKKTASRKATKSTRSASTKSSSAPTLPRRIYAQASPHSIGGLSMFDFEGPITSNIVANFTSEQELMNRAVVRLQEAGFDVLQVTETTINIAGSARTYETAFNTSIVAEERPTLKSGRKEDLATFIESTNAERPGLISTRGTAFADLLEGVAIEEPYYLMTPSIFAPPRTYWHLDVPGDVSVGCNADQAHRSGITGRDIKVAMVDSGWYKHPFFVSRGYRSSPVVLGPDTADPDADENGHGTGESANIFAVAPDVQLLPVKAKLAGTENQVLVNTQGAFDLAVGLNPHVISCSWGLSYQNGPLSAAAQALAASVAAAVASGIVVVFAAGNGHWGFPGQHPDVISVGGVYMDQNEAMRASSYSSGFMSNIYPGRRVPDLSGLVGLVPKAIYIMLPIPEGSGIDTSYAGGTFPNGDETGATDGWGAFSGTSAACPQVAGAAALVKQACPHLSPAVVRNILMKSARDVTTGTNAHGNTAVAGPDTATGNGLVDAYKAVLLAKLNCLTIAPIGPTPITPIGPTPITPIGPTPITPVGPTPPTPITPVGPTPITPIGPTPITPVGPTPITPIGPTPITPVGPVPIRPITPTPIQPIVPIRPIGPDPLRRPSLEEGAVGAQASRQAGLTQEDVAALEELILDSKVGEEDLP